MLDPEIEKRLRGATGTNSRVTVDLTLDDIDDLLGCVAAEANHSGDGKARRLLDPLCDQLSRLLDQFTDETPPVAVRPIVAATKPRFSAKQGQYLAFIYHFTKIHRQPPAEADLRQYFNVSPPAVHEMILTLERHGFISRVPGKARSIKLLVSRTELPELA
jgi:repressor LexA